MSSSQSALEKEIAMVLIPEKNEYAIGSIPDFMVIIKNSSSVPLHICEYMLDYRLKAAMIARSVTGGIHYELQPFEPVKWDITTERTFRMLQPDEEIKKPLQLSGERLFGFIRRDSQPPKIPSSYIIKGFPADTFEFRTAILDEMAIYVGDAGLFDFRLEARQLKELPGAPARNLFLSLLEAKAKVTFK